MTTTCVSLVLFPPMNATCSLSCDVMVDVDYSEIVFQNKQCRNLFCCLPSETLAQQEHCCERLSTTTTMMSHLCSILK
jgi:hypothetical protein